MATTMWPRKTFQKKLGGKSREAKCPNLQVSTMDLDFQQFCHCSFVSSQHTCADRLQSLQRRMLEKERVVGATPHVQRVALTTRLFGALIFFGSSEQGRRCTSKAQSHQTSWLSTWQMLIHNHLAAANDGSVLTIHWESNLEAGRHATAQKIWWP